ncbi:hypothetical protein GCM10022256_33640 [Frondihabitans peucedani]|uniref:FtsK domain-containing protein n=1 Tax=Frondihabitans peucedani TaxID=598626 RepID=A0ABP8E6H3_9MICO
MIIGTTEDGLLAQCSLEDSLHTLVTGETRSGKSVTTYAILAQARVTRDC